MNIADVGCRMFDVGVNPRQPHLKRSAILNFQNPGFRTQI